MRLCPSCRSDLGGVELLFVQIWERVEADQRGSTGRAAGALQWDSEPTLTSKNREGAAVNHKKH